MLLEGSSFRSIRLLLVAALAAAVTLAIPAPVHADENGRYPVPEPGKKKKREY